jgi:hypothetical protein
MNDTFGKGSTRESIINEAKSYLNTITTGFKLEAIGSVTPMIGHKKEQQTMRVPWLSAEEA